MRRQVRARASVLAALVLANLIGACPALAEQAQWLSPGPTIPRVTLTDDAGRTWPLGELLRSRPVLIGFFFTGCTTICPLQTATMQAVHKELGKRIRAGVETPLLLSISLDPLGDTPSAIRQYADQFGIDLGEDHGWLMLTGSRDELAPVWQNFDEGGVATDHTGLLWVGQPGNGRWIRLSATSMAEPIVNLLLEPRR